MTPKTQGEPPQRVIQAWLDAGDGADEVEPQTVPGTNRAERRRLARLGSLTQSLLTRNTDDGAVERLNDLPGLKDWLNGGPVPPVEVCEAGEELLAAPGEDALAGIYSAAVSPANRRRLGTFFTPRAEVKQMLAAWTLLGAESPQTVVDVGAGVGIFTLAAAHLWPAAGIHAVDVNPVTLGLLGLRAATEHLLTEPRSPHGGGVRLHLDDYLDFAQAQLPGLPGPRLILGNPPYTRIQLLPQNERQRLIESTGGLCGSRASLAAVITAATIQSMGAEDGLCLLLPAHWLESDYASGLRSWLWAATSRPVRLHMFGHDLFPDAQVDTVSLLVGPVADGDHPLLLSSAGSATEVELTRLAGCPARWRSLFRGAPKQRSSQPPGPPLSDFARIRRGVATGANSFFVLTQPLVDEWDLPKATTAPIVRRLRDHPADEVTLKDVQTLPARDRRWLLTATSAQVLADPRVAAYIQHGEELNLPSRVLCQDRATWHDLSGEATIHDVIVGPSTKSTFRFVQNLAGAHIANNLYGLTWRPGLPVTQQAEILAWFRSAPGQRAIKTAARTQGGGLLKIEPRALNSLCLPARFKSPAGRQG